MIGYRQGPDGWIATADVAVGVERHRIRLDLGRLPGEPDPGGLRGVPVVVVPQGRTPIARAGAQRAGGVPTVFIVAGDAPRLAGQFLVAVAEEVEVIFVEGVRAGALEVARGLNGRPILVPEISDPAALTALLAILRADVHIAIPAAEDLPRVAVHEVLERLDPDQRHHRVQVDPRPAFDESGADILEASDEEIAAAAAGVLAGRLVAMNRRWREDA